MCAGCFTHVLADARLRDELATCPNCRIEISKTSASRNLAVEKAVSELPAECQYCAKEFPRNSLERHEESMCEERYIRFNPRNILFHCKTFFNWAYLSKRNFNPQVLERVPET